MNLKDQVLSIAQAQELQELGFDVKKNASMCWAKLFDHNNFYRILNKEYAEYIELNDYIPTMSIGDIIEVLPNLINTERFLYRLEINNSSVYYIDRIKNTGIYFYNKGLIDNLFETLKWCITNKYLLS